MKCQLKYRWVKLPRACLPQGKGVLGQWARLAARAAYRKGVGLYCGFENPVEPGMWAGGVVGLKSILGTRSRKAALETLEQLQALGYLSYSLDSTTKNLEYRLLDWVCTCTGEASVGESVYAYQGQGFLCLPRSLPDRLTKQHYIFEEADALLDLWCHTVWQEPRNIFSHRAPTVPVWLPGRRFDVGNTGPPLGLGKDQGMEVFQKTRGCLPSVPSARRLRLPGVQRPIPHGELHPGHGDSPALPGGTSAHNRSTAFLRGQCADCRE